MKTKRYHQQENDNGSDELRPPKRQAKVIKSQALETPHCQCFSKSCACEGHKGLVQLTYFVEKLRHAILSQHVLQRGIASVDLVDESFVAKAGMLLEQSAKDDAGNVKLDIAFRDNGVFMEGWLYIRHMETNNRQPGFKVRALGALPLLMWTTLIEKGNDEKDVADGVQKKKILDQVMKQVHAILVECLSPVCRIVPLQSCDDLWLRSPPSCAGIEVRDAMELARSLGLVSKTLEEEVDSLEARDSADEEKGNFVKCDLDEKEAPAGTPDIESCTDDIESCTDGGANIDSNDEAELGTRANSLAALACLKQVLIDSQFHSSLWKAIATVGVVYCIFHFVAGLGT